MRKIFFCLAFVNLQAVCAQSFTWCEGSVVLASCQVMVGKIALHEKHDLIIFEQDGRRTVYPAHKVRSLSFFDRESNINRRYLSVKQDFGSRSIYQLFEVVLSGSVDVIRRRKPSSIFNNPNAHDFNYFTRHRGELTLLKKFKTKVYPQLRGGVDDRLEEFVASNRLSADLPTNAIRIIEFYNSLTFPEEPIARH